MRKAILDGFHFLLSETAASGGGAGWFVKAQMRLLV
jgi:hypothetical protein